MKQDRQSEWVNLETDLESQVTETLFSQYGVLGVKLVMVNNSGWPDHVFLGPKAKVVFVEFKRGFNERSPRQNLIRKLLRAFGFTVQTHNNKDCAVQEILKALGMVTKAYH